MPTIWRPSTSSKGVAGSHGGEWCTPGSFLDQQAPWFPDGSLTELPDIDGDPDRLGILGDPMDHPPFPVPWTAPT